jgi:Cu+-exporting ATPase
MQMTDPVCGVQIDSAKAEATETFQGRTYYFCSASCRDNFRRAPERYAKEVDEGRGSRSA